MPAPIMGLPTKLPQQGVGGSNALDQLAPIALDGCAQLSHPGYLAHMDPASAEVAAAAAIWQVATNQNLLHPDAAPSARGLESVVINWLAPYFGMQGGHLVPGTTVANLTALWAARDVGGAKRVVASDRAHNSLRKAADILGLTYEVMPSDPSTHVCSMKYVDEDLSDAVVVYTAGTVATGAIDDLMSHPPSGAGWVHVDAAWAGPVRLSDRLAPLLDGVELADSVGFSAHKWLYQPKGCAAVLFKCPDAAHAAMSYGGGYLATPTIGILGSAPANALPLAATLLAWGRDGVAARLEADVAQIRILASMVAADERFELWEDEATAGRAGVLVWRPRVAGASDIRSRLRGAWISLTTIDGEVWFRSVAANPQADTTLVFRCVVDALESMQ
jgi:L-2,4-diaminobutyrate decarboxylase